MLTLRTARTVTYTPPPSAADRAAMRELERLDAQPQRTDDDERRRQELIRGAAVAQLRFTVSTMTVAQYGRYEANKRAAVAWMQATYQDAETEEANTAGLAALRWAYTLAALIGLETCTANRAADDAGTWQAMDIPATWQTPAGYMDEIPADLAAVLAEAVFQVNPGLFGAPPYPTDDAKKNGGISVA